MTIKLNGSTAGSVSLDAPASTTSSADIQFKLPVADGTAGQVLKTDGSGNLSWVTVADTNDCVKLASSNVSPADATFTYDSLNNSTYHYYKLIWQGVPNVDNATLYFRWRTGSADITDSLYNWTNIGITGGGTVYDNGGQSDNQALVFYAAGNAVGEGWNIEFTLKPQQAQPSSGSSVWVTGDRFDNDGVSFRGERNQMRLKKDVSPNGFQVYPASGTFAQYQYTLYGFTK